MRVSVNALGNSESDGLRCQRHRLRGAQESLPTTPVTRTADSTGIPGGYVSKLKLTAGNAFGELSRLGRSWLGLSLPNRQVLLFDNWAAALPQIGSLSDKCRTRFHQGK